jgi:hypothetical protein
MQARSVNKGGARGSLLLFALLAETTLYAASPMPAGLPRFLDDQRGIAFSYPLGWSVGRMRASEYRVLVQSADGRESCAYTIDSDPSLEKVSDTVVIQGTSKQMIEEVLRSVYSAKPTVNDFQKTTIGGRPAIHATFTYRDQQTGAAMRAYAASFKVRAAMHMFICSGPVVRADQNNLSYLTTLWSVRIR